MLRYRSRLDRDLERWRTAGWVSSAGADAIRADLDAQGRGFGLSTVLATLAAVLIGFGAMSFVAANWQSMSKLPRLATIFGAMWALIYAAYHLHRRDLGRFADAALLTASAVYGAGIMLIAQMYHMDGHPPDAVLLWGIGTVAAGLLTRSNPTLAAALVLFVVWSGMESLHGSNLFWNRATAVHGWFLPAWATVAAGFAVTRWRPGLHLLAIALSWWIIWSGYHVGRGNELAGHAPVLAVGLALMAASVAFGPAIDRWRQVSGTMLNYGLVIAFAGAFALQFIVDRPGHLTFVLGALTLIGLLATIGWAWRLGNRPAMWIAYGCFAVEVFSLYLKKIGTLLGTSGFFLSAGLVVAGLAFAAYRLHDSRPAGATS